MSEEIQLDNRIQRVGDEATKAFTELKKIQTGQKKLLKTGEEMIDCHIGSLLASDVLLLAGSPGAGKSETLYRMIEKMMSKEVNPTADNFVSLEYSMEVKMLNKILRASHNLLGKEKSKILFDSFTEDEAKKVKEYYENLQDDRRYVVQSPVTPEDFYKMSRDFCRLHTDKDAVILSSDHLLLHVGTDKQAVLEKMSEYVNLLKLEFENVYFVLVSQTNRGAISTIKEKSNDMMPNNTHLFGSSFMEQLASYIVIITNPYSLGVNEYLRVSPDRFDYLEEFFTSPDTKGRVSFNTLGNLFFFVTKTRESDKPWRNIFIKKMDLTKEQLNKLKNTDDEEKTTPQIQMPIFDAPKFNTSPKDAFEAEEEPF